MGLRDRLRKLRPLQFLDDRLGLASVVKHTLDKVFPNQWSFLLGEIALYSFVVLVLTGVYLSFFFDPSTAETTYRGSYDALVGVEMSRAYQSTIELSFDVRAGLVMRQMHHWAALVFIGAIVAHLMRVFFTGAFRRPRELNWIIGCTLLLLAIVNGFAGYSLLDDQLSGTGLRIAYSIVISIPLVGTWLASLAFGGDFPGVSILERLFVIHILIVPVAIAALLLAHLGILVRHKHTHFAGHGATETNVVGERLWPTYVFKSTGLFFLTAGVLAALGGLVQINPIWLYGPFQTADVSTASQPDWYMGWLEGAMRLMPAWEIRAFGYEVANPFFPGVLLPGVTFTLLYIWPFLEAWRTRDYVEHHVLDRPRDRPVRTAIGTGALAFYTVLGIAGGDDVLATTFDLSINRIVWILRIALFVVPALVAWGTYVLCHDLQRRDATARLEASAATEG
jgi:ubiquinol-cytochrome c reductase cytochrome b subunit